MALRSFSHVGIPVLGLVLSSVAMPLPAQAGSNSSGVSYYSTLSCGQLWYQRNAIFAQAGFCFKSKRARAVFGPRCYAPYGKLSSAKRSVVNEIKRWERRKGC